MLRLVGSSPPSAASGGIGRDLRADVLRGVALLCVLWNHTFLLLGEKVPFFLQLTPRYWGITSAAEMFVFLSGSAYGATYLRLADSRGVRAVYARSLRRAWQLYVASAVTVLVVLGIVSLWHVHGVGANHATSVRLRLDRYLAPAPDLFWNLVTMRRMPAGFDILSLYIVLLLFAPVYLVLTRKDWRLALLVGLVPYAVVQFHVTVPFNRLGTGWWFFNPLAWQILFLLGILAASGRVRAPRDRWITRIAAAIVVAVGIQMWVLKRMSLPIEWLREQGVAVPRAVGDLLSIAREYTYPFAGVNDLEPIRLLYFCLLVLLVAAVTSSTDPLWSRRAARPIALLGQSSLEVFCFGTIYVYAAVAIRPSLPAGWAVTLAIIVFGFLCSLGFAQLVQMKRALVRDPRFVPLAIPASDEHSPVVRQPVAVQQRSSAGGLHADPAGQD